jgi:chitinase
LFDPTNGVLPGTGTTTTGRTATGVIIDDDAKISVAGTDPATGIATATIAEPAPGGGIGTTVLPITLQLSQPVQQQVSVRYATRDLSARAGSDYLAASGTAVFAPGASSVTINITILADTFVEGDEVFFVDLTAPANAALATSAVRCTITNTGAPSPTTGSPSVTLNAAPIAEGNAGQTNAVFTLRLAAASASPLTVTYTTANGTAVAGRDYVARVGSVVFAPGETVKTVTVPVMGNTRIDGNRTFDLVLSLGTGTAARPLGRSTATIVDDDSVAPSRLRFAGLGSSLSMSSVSGSGTSLGRAAAFAAAGTKK